MPVFLGYLTYKEKKIYLWVNTVSPTSRNTTCSTTRDKEKYEDN